jgi:hypothetical protein
MQGWAKDITLQYGEGKPFNRFCLPYKVAPLKRHKNEKGTLSQGCSRVFSKQTYVIPQNFLFAARRKKIYAESDLISIGEKPNRIPDRRCAASGMTCMFILKIL